MATLPPVGAGKVVGRMVSFDADGSDGDLFPDANPLIGQVTFTPSLVSMKVPGATPAPATAWPSAITANLDANGYLSQSPGVLGVWLIPTDDQSINPSGFTYMVSANLHTLSNRIVAFNSFSISVPTWDPTANGGLGNAVDLTNVSPVSASNGTPVTQGPPGPPVSLQVRNVTTTTDPTAAAVTIVPSANPLIELIDFVLPIGSGGGGGGTGTVTKVAGISPDGTGNVLLTPANIGAAVVADVVTAQTTASNALSQANTAQAGANTAQTTANAAQSGLSGKVDNATLGLYAALASPTLTGAPKAPTAATADNSTLIATTAFVKAVVAAIAVSGIFGAAVVGWNTTTNAWYAARPAITGPVLWLSTNSSTATRPVDMAIGDAWEQHPDSVTA